MHDDLSLFNVRTGLAPEAIGAQLRQAQDQGWLAIEAGRVRPTEAGRRFNNDLVSLFL